MSSMFAKILGIGITIAFVVVPVIALADTVSQCPIISERLTLGSHHTQVTFLKRYLVSAGFMGSNNYTTYFGPLTQSALRKWQCSKGLVCGGTPGSTGYGATGPATRTALKKCNLTTLRNTQTVESYATATSSQSKSVSVDQRGTICESLLPGDRALACRTGHACTFNGAIVAHGQSVIAYRIGNATIPAECQSQSRTCSDGVLDGTYTHASCTVDPCFASSDTGGPTIASWQDPTRMRVYQRHAGFGVVPIGVRTTSPTQCLQARVRSVESKEIVPWTTVAKDVIGAGQSIAGSLKVPNGGWYFVDVRAINNGSAGPVGTIDYIGVGEVFITAGQSNATFFGQTPQHTATGKVTYFDGTMWTLCQDPLAQVDPQFSGGAPWCLLGDQAVRGYGVPVAFAPTGWGGTSIDQWQLTQATPIHGAQGFLLKRLEERVKYFGTDGIRAILWHQGESDVTLRTSAATYSRKLSNLIQYIRDAGGYTIPWFVSEVTYGEGGDGPDSLDLQEQKASVLAGQRAVVNNQTIFSGAKTDSLTGPYRYDGVHMSVAGLEAEATLWASAINDAIQKIGL